MDKAAFRKAVEDSEEPTPGYLYQTLSQWTYTDRSTQNQLLDALFDKLKPPSSGVPRSARVLYKVLHLIRVLCESGHPDFQKEVQAGPRSAALKYYASYRGQPDPLHGDALNESVRQEAAKALEVAFNARPERRDDLAGERARGSGSLDLGGFGNPVYAATAKDPCGFSTGARVGGSGAGQGGTGSPDASTRGGRVGDMPQENRWMAYVAELESARAGPAASTLLQQLTDKARAGWELIREHEGLKRAEDRIYDGAAKRAVRQGADAPTRGGGGAARYVYDQTELTAGHYMPVGLPARPETDAEGAREESPTITGCDETADPTHEPSLLEHAAVTATATPAPSRPPLEGPFRRVVHRLASTRGTAPRAELAAFVAESLAEGARLGTALADGPAGEPSTWDPFMATAPSDSAGSAGPAVSAFAFLRPGPAPTVGWAALACALDEELHPTLPWQHRLNALCGLEALLQRGGAGGHEGESAAAAAAAAAVERYFRQSPGNVRRNTHVAQSSLREKAVRVAGLLGIPTDPPAPVLPAASPPTTPGPSLAEVGGLNFDGLTLRAGGGRPLDGAGLDNLLGPLPPRRRPSIEGTALDELFEAAPAAPSAAVVRPPPGAAAGTGRVEDLLDPAPPAGRAGPRITVLGVYDSGGGVAGVGGMHPTPTQQQQQGSWAYGSYGAGGAAPAVESSTFVSTGGVPSSGPPPGSVQSMNRALAAMQRKLMEESPPQP